MFLLISRGENYFDTPFPFCYIHGSSAGKNIEISADRYRFLSGNNSAVECNLAKVEVAGSNPVSRSILLTTKSKSFFIAAVAEKCGVSQRIGDFLVKTKCLCLSQPFSPISALKKLFFWAA